MNSTRIIVAAVLALAVSTVQSADKAEGKVDRKTQESEARLAQRLEGRAVGEPVSCIPLLRPNQLEVIEGVALVYDTGDTIYVARPTEPQTLSRDDVVIIDRHTSQLCNTDVVRTVDRNTGFFTGVVFLGKFETYKKQN